MKASLITIHTGSNYGTVLQVIASVYVLKKHNIDVTVVNYIPPRSTYNAVRNHYKQSIKSKSGLAKIKELLISFHAINHQRKTNQIYLGTIKRYCSLSKRIFAEDSFVDKCPKADLYITGSDQVWNTYHNRGIDTHYFFDGIIGRKIALASSIGMDSLSAEEKRVYKSFLSEYEAISVRESKAVELLQEIGIESVHVLDPTLMLNRDEWCQVISFKRLISEKYLLVYTPYNTHDKNEILTSARRIALEKSLRIVSFLGPMNKSDNIDYLLSGVGPVGFLSLMYHADYVITNSFHGTAFSINMNRPFLVYLPTKFPSRLESLLNLCGLSNRIVGEESEGINEDETINYDSVNSILNVEREKFHNFVAQIYKTL